MEGIAPTGSRKELARSRKELAEWSAKSPRQRSATDYQGDQPTIGRSRGPRTPAWQRLIPPSQGLCQWEPGVDEKSTSCCSANANLVPRAAHPPTTAESCCPCSARRPTLS